MVDMSDDDANQAVTQDILRLREAYISEVLALAERGRMLEARGFTIEDVARILHAERRALGVKYKELTPPALREKIYRRNLALYNDPLGPTIEYLRDELGRTWEEIIESASRPGGKDIRT